MCYAMYHDIKLIDKIDTRVNFIIKCDDESQLDALKQQLNTKKRLLSYDEFINQFGKDSKQ